MTASMFFDDFEVGQVFDSPGRTVTEADLSLFCMISGDWHPIHSDEVFARTTPFGRRVVAGVFGIAVITGMMGRWGIFEDSVVAMTSLDDWRFRRPIFVGDTLRVRMTILDKQLSRGGTRGLVDRGFLLRNQAEDVVQEGRSAALVLRRTASAGAGTETTGGER